MPKKEGDVITVKEGVFEKPFYNKKKETETMEKEGTDKEEKEVLSQEEIFLSGIEKFNEYASKEIANILTLDKESIKNAANKAYNNITQELRNQVSDIYVDIMSDAQKNNQSIISLEDYINKLTDNVSAIQDNITTIINNSNLNQESKDDIIKTIINQKPPKTDEDKKQFMGAVLWGLSQNADGLDNLQKSRYLKIIQQDLEDVVKDYEDKYGPIKTSSDDNQKTQDELAEEQKNRRKKILYITLIVTLSIIVLLASLLGTLLKNADQEDKQKPEPTKPDDKNKENDIQGQELKATPPQTPAITEIPTGDAPKSPETIKQITTPEGSASLNIDVTTNDKNIIDNSTSNIANSPTLINSNTVEKKQDAPYNPFGVAPDPNQQHITTNIATLSQDEIKQIGGTNAVVDTENNQIYRSDAIYKELNTLGHEPIELQLSNGQTIKLIVNPYANPNNQKDSFITIEELNQLTNGQTTIDKIIDSIPPNTTITSLTYENSTYKPTDNSFVDSNKIDDLNQRLENKLNNTINLGKMIKEFAPAGNTTGQMNIPLKNIFIDTDGDGKFDQSLEAYFQNSNNYKLNPETGKWELNTPIEKIIAKGFTIDADGKQETTTDIITINKNTHPAIYAMIEKQAQSLENAFEAQATKQQIAYNIENDKYKTLLNDYNRKVNYNAIAAFIQKGSMSQTNILSSKEFLGLEVSEQERLKTLIDNTQSLNDRIKTLDKLSAKFEITTNLGEQSDRNTLLKTLNTEIAKLQNPTTTQQQEELKTLQDARDALTALGKTYDEIDKNYSTQTKLVSNIKSYINERNEVYNVAKVLHEKKIISDQEYKLYETYNQENEKYTTNFTKTINDNLTRIQTQYNNSNPLNQPITREQVVQMIYDTKNTNLMQAFIGENFTAELQDPIKLNNILAKFTGADLSEIKATIDIIGIQNVLLSKEEQKEMQNLENKVNNAKTETEKANAITEKTDYMRRHGISSNQIGLKQTYIRESDYIQEFAKNAKAGDVITFKTNGKVFDIWNDSQEQTEYKIIKTMENTFLVDTNAKHQEIKLEQLITSQFDSNGNITSGNDYNQLQHIINAKSPLEQDKFLSKTIKLQKDTVINGVVFKAGSDLTVTKYSNGDVEFFRDDNQSGGINEGELSTKLTAEEMKKTDFNLAKTTLREEDFNDFLNNAKEKDIIQFKPKKTFSVDVKGTIYPFKHNETVTVTENENGTYKFQQGNTMVMLSQKEVEKFGYSNFVDNQNTEILKSTTNQTITNANKIVSYNINNKPAQYNTSNINQNLVKTH